MSSAENPVRASDMTSEPPSTGNASSVRSRSVSFETPHIMPELDECPTPAPISAVIATAVGAAALAPTPGSYFH